MGCAKNRTSHFVCLYYETIEEGTTVRKGIFWCYKKCSGGDYQVGMTKTVSVGCDISGNPLEEAEFSSKSGENFNHKIEWEKSSSKICRARPFNCYPRGRVEIKNGKIKIYANPILIEDDKARSCIEKSFELEAYRDEIKWIADNSRHYEYESYYEEEDI